MRTRIEPAPVRLLRLFPEGEGDAERTAIELLDRADRFLDQPDERRVRALAGLQRD